MMRIEPLIFGLSLNARPLPEVRADTSAEPPSDGGLDQPAPPATAAEGHAIEDDPAGRWRGLDPAGLPPKWRGTVRQLWSDMARQGRQASTPPRQPSLTALSDETISQIAGLLPDADIGRLSLVNHRLRDTLADERKAHRLLGQALQANLPGQFRALLRAPGEGVHTILGLGFSRQERLLEALGERIRVLPEGDRRAAFNLIHDAITAKAFPMKHRAAPLAELARQSSDLPEDFRWDALSGIVDATGALPVQCRSEQLTAVAGGIHSLQEPKHQWLMLNRVHAALASLDQEHRVAPLTAIAEQLSAELTELSDARRRNMFNRILADTGRMPEQALRVAPLKALAHLIPSIPVSYRRVAFNGVLAALANIAENDRRPLLRLLLGEIRSLPDADRPQAFGRLLPQIPLLPEGDRYDAFTHALAAIESLAVAGGPAPGSDLLTHLWRQLPSLPQKQWPMAHQLVQAAYMAPDVRRHYADSIWADRLAIVPDPAGTPVVLERATPDGTTESRQYWAGSVLFDEAGIRNVLLEPVDSGGARRWYLVGRDGERLSQYLERRYSGTLTSDSVAPAPPRLGRRQQRALRRQR